VINYRNIRIESVSLDVDLNFKDNCDSSINYGNREALSNNELSSLLHQAASVDEGETRDSVLDGED